MNREDLKSLLEFAKSKDLMHHPFIEVYNLWCQWWQEYFEEAEADAYNSTIEAHELPFLD